MANDEGRAQVLRDALAGMPDTTEKRMFGGLCFLMNGNMLCGVHKDGAMFRVGKAREPDALAIPGAGPMTFTGRRMGGIIAFTGEALGDAEPLGRWLALARALVATLPAKKVRPAPQIQALQMPCAKLGKILYRN